MPHTEIVMRVRFRSELSFEEIAAIVEERAPEFEALAGLRQKYYLHDGAGSYAGLYVWDSMEALEAFRNSELRATIGRAYQAVAEPDVEVFRVFKILRGDQA